MKRRNKITAVLLGAGALVLAGGVALAGHGHHHDPAAMRRHAVAHVAAMLDVLEATPAQRKVAEQARDRVLGAIQREHGDKRADLGRVLDLFSADKLDRGALGALRKKHEAAALRIGDAVVQSVFELHAVLTPAQRKTLVQQVKDNRPRLTPMRLATMKHLAGGRADEVLRSVGATEPQRFAVQAAIDHVVDTIEHQEPQRAAAIDRALALLVADRIDKAQADKVRAAHDLALHRMIDAAELALDNIHEALAPAQRKALVALVKARHPMIDGKPGQH